MLYKIGPYKKVGGMDNSWYGIAKGVLTVFEVSESHTSDGCFLIDPELQRSYPKGEYQNRILWVHRDWLEPTMDCRSFFNAM